MRLSPVRRRPPDEQEPWQLSLADMMTLILCFFVIVVAVSTVDSERYAQVAEQFSQDKPQPQPGKGPQPQPREAPSASVPAAGPATAASNATRDPGRLVADLQSRLGAEQYGVSLERRERGAVLSIRGSVLFALGAAELTPRARAVLDPLAAALAGAPYRFSVEGHSDNLPVRGGRFPSNWELSAARAAAVARYLMERGLPPERFTVVGRADTQPLAPNVDAAGRPIAHNQALNRRVVVQLELVD
jgi:chemotaxis protein MotB